MSNKGEFASVTVWLHIIIGDYVAYQRKGILSSPIFMDNVACYGSENKLIDCSYNTDTTEDEHLNDIWINCNVASDKEQVTQATSDTTEVVSPSANTLTNESSTTTSTVSLVVALIGLGISMVVIAFLIGYILYKRKRKTNGIDM